MTRVPSPVSGHGAQPSAPSRTWLFTLVCTACHAGWEVTGEYLRDVAHAPTCPRCGRLGLVRGGYMVVPLR